MIDRSTLLSEAIFDKAIVSLGKHDPPYPGPGCKNLGPILPSNPIATILSFSMALRYSLDMDKEADTLDNAVQQVLDDGLRTKDIVSKGTKEVTTSQMGDAIISKLK